MIGVLIAVASGLLAATYAAVITGIIRNGLLIDEKIENDDGNNEGRRRDELSVNERKVEQRTNS